MLFRKIILSLRCVLVFFLLSSQFSHCCKPRHKPPAIENRENTHTDADAFGIGFGFGAAVGVAVGVGGLLMFSNPAILVAFVGIPLVAAGTADTLSRCYRPRP
jgi:hypothetical protein